VAKIGQFNPQENNPNDGYREAPPPMPNGWTPMFVADSSVERSKKNPDNQMVRMKLQVCEDVLPDYKGRMVFENYNLFHSNAETVKIAKDQFSKLLLRS